MSLVRNFSALTSMPNTISLQWDQPVGFNNTTDEIIVTKTITHFPSELYNSSHSSCATDSRPIEIFRGSTIVGIDVDTISVVDRTITDTSASFPTSPSLKGRLLRDSNSRVFRIESNTSTSITVEESNNTPVSGKYVVLPDFPSDSRAQQNFEVDSRTIVDTGSISTLIEATDGALLEARFTIDEVANMVFKDGDDNRFIIKSNTTNTLNFNQSVSFDNTGLVTFTYTSGTGIVQFGSAVDLSKVKIGHKFVDSAGTKFDITAVDDGADNITIASGLTIDVSAPTTSDHGSIVIVPVIGPGMAILNSFVDSQPLSYIDNFRTSVEAAAREGTELLDNQFYYYTGFTLPLNANVAQADFSTYTSATSTQASGISTIDKDFKNLLFNLWPSLYRELDSTGDLEDLMEVFGFQFNELHALISTYNLQNTHTVFVNALVPLSEQFGLPSIGFSIGIDTMRRISNDMVNAWKLKGSKEGIFLFIRILTTWDITNGSADFSSAISDFLPNVDALRFFDPNLGTLNTRLTQTSPFVSGGRFAKSLPGIVIPGFFTFREFVIDIPQVALFVGDSESFSLGSGTTTMVDSGNNFGTTNSLVGNFLIPNEEEVNDIFEITANTSNSITVRGIINNRVAGGNYVVLSPLNANRFIILNKLLPLYIPFGTKAGFRFLECVT